MRVLASSGRLLWCDDAAQLLLQPALELLVAQGSSGSFVLLECLNLLVGCGAGEQASPTLCERQRRRHTDKAVVLPLQVRLGTAPDYVASFSSRALLAQKGGLDSHNIWISFWGAGQVEPCPEHSPTARTYQ